MAEQKTDNVVGVEVADLTPDVVPVTPETAEERRILLQIRLQHEVIDEMWRERKQGGNGDE
jgi:hypothetical protein